MGILHDPYNTFTELSALQGPEAALRAMLKASFQEGLLSLSAPTEEDRLFREWVTDVPSGQPPKPEGGL